MANITFGNLKQNFSIWRDEIDNHATEKLPGSFATATASGHIVTLHGTNFEYQNGVPRGGHVDSLDIKLGGLKEFADITIDGLDTNFVDFAEVVSAPTPTERTMALWSTALRGNDSFSFGDTATTKGLYVNFAGDGYDAPATRVGGNDVFTGDVGQGSIAGDFVFVAAGREAAGGSDTFQLSKSVNATITGDIISSEQGSSFVAGNDKITLAHQGYVYGDAINTQGAFVAGNDTILGSSEDDDIAGDINTVAATSSGRFGNDLIHGGEGNDYISGDYSLNLSANFTGGDDKLFGDAGDDRIFGNEGNDLLRGGDGADTLDGGQGYDTADYRDKTASVRVSLDADGDGVVTVGGIAEDTISNIENLVGGSAGDKFVAGKDYNSNRFDGRGGNDTLDGGGAHDTLIGGKGNDKLKGDFGMDQFVFNAKLGSSNVDRIVDFEHAADKIVLDDSSFKALGSTFDKSEFVALKTGHDATKTSQHVIYDKAHGSLWYDADGKGGHAAIQFAQLGSTATHPVDLNWHDFAIV